MAVASQDELYRALLARLRDLVPLDDAYIYLRHQAAFVGGEDSRYVQLIPGAPEARYPNAGHGLVREEFQVSTWFRGHLDRREKDDIRIADADDERGALRLVRDTRLTLIQYWPVEVTEPVVFIRGAVAQANIETAPGWVSLTDTYRVGYHLQWPQVAVTELPA